MNYALIKNESVGLGRVMNIIVADPEFIKSIAPDWDHIEAMDTLHEQGVGMGWGYDFATGKFIDPAPAINPVLRPRIVLAGITADAVHADQLVLKGLNDVTCSAGTTLTVGAKLLLGEQTQPLNEVFRMPFRARDGRERILLARMVQGVISFTVSLPESGLWRVAEAAINEALPPEKQMQFDGITIYVVDA
ncbi:hypothetical protein D8B23_12865 [Verminephrobacter aporrectodeae subsp. tuberculatae]|uniref:hypothetical protein n=1 Tax=Verminephrobacter aporrectodeae TaxID=1110389 RepID=UPI00224417D0|nr:hypothetical protein [Verminephrobacter aporrectodeae]MCW8199291.1 hypothetical protein [Verminephrobacter aporrectodeae subsp. tuberculatae]